MTCSNLIFGTSPFVSTFTGLVPVAWAIAVRGARRQGQRRQDRENIASARFVTVHGVSPPRGRYSDPCSTCLRYLAVMDEARHASPQPDPARWLRSPIELRPHRRSLRKAQALLAYLALRPGQPHPRSKLAALLWGDAGEDEARNSLRQTLFGLRRAVAVVRAPVLLDRRRVGDTQRVRRQRGRRGLRATGARRNDAGTRRGGRPLQGRSPGRARRAGRALRGLAHGRAPAPARARPSERWRSSSATTSRRARTTAPSGGAQTAEPSSRSRRRSIGR